MWTRPFIIGLALILAVFIFAGSAAGEMPGEQVESEAMQKLGQTYYLTQTEGTLIAYMVSDPQCPACQALQERIEEGMTPDVELLYLTVGFMGQESLHLAAERLQRNLPVDGDEAVSENTRIAAEIGVRAVPTVFYQTPQGEVRKFTGSGKENLEALQRLTRQAEE